MADVAGIYIDTIVAFASAMSQPPRIQAVTISEPGTFVATQKYLMQAWDSVTNAQFDWLSDTPDWTGVFYPGPNSPTDIAIAGILVHCP